MTCAICGIRKPRRSCPGVNGDICSICCGTGREETIDCPLECDYLAEAHEHEKPVPLEPNALPNSEIDLPEEFLQSYEWLLVLLGLAALEGVSKSPGITDYDMREAFESLVSMYRASESGLVYETLPVNPYASAVVEAVQARVADLRKRETETRGTSSIDDSLLLKMTVFLQRLEYANNNGRRRSRSFITFLSNFFASVPEALTEEDVEPDEPLIIL